MLEFDFFPFFWIKLTLMQMLFSIGLLIFTRLTYESSVLNLYLAGVTVNRFGILALYNCIVTATTLN